MANPSGTCRPHGWADAETGELEVSGVWRACLALRARLNEGLAPSRVTTIVAEAVEQLPGVEAAFCDLGPPAGEASGCSVRPTPRDGALWTRVVRAVGAQRAAQGPLADLGAPDGSACVTVPVAGLPVPAARKPAAGMPAGVIGALLAEGRSPGDLSDALLVMADLLAAHLAVSRGRYPDATHATPHPGPAGQDPFSGDAMAAALRYSPFAVFVLDPERRVRVGNVVEGASLDPGQVIGRRCFEALPCAASGCASCGVQESLDGGQAVRRTVLVTTGAGSRRLEVLSCPMHEAGARGVLVVLRDVTREQRMVEALVLVEKHAVIGRLASGIAHEINTPLSVILLNTDLLFARLAPEDPLRESVELIRRGAERAGQAVRNLQSLARDETYRYAMVDVNSTIEAAVALVAAHAQKHRVQVVLAPGPQLPQTRASAKHLEHVWATLMLNCVSAILEHQELGQVHVESRCDGREIAVTVQRDGPKVPSERLADLFAPFGAMAAESTGTGLGLYSCQQIVEHHGGTIRGRNLPLVGFEFAVRLPLRDREPEATA